MATGQPINKPPQAASTSMEITTVIYARNREEWRAWLENNHVEKTEIWLQTYHKASGKEIMPYDDAVEEALCFGWIDGITKKYDHESSVQRYTPRRKKSFLSELNRQRIFKLIRQGKMTPSGLAPIEHLLGDENAPLVIPDDVLSALREDPTVWQTFDAFPITYKKTRIGFIQETRDPEVRQKRLNYLIRMTKKGKMYGTIV